MTNPFGLRGAQGNHSRSGSKAIVACNAMALPALLADLGRISRTRPAASFPHFLPADRRDRAETQLASPPRPAVTLPDCRTSHSDREVATAKRLVIHFQKAFFLLPRIVDVAASA